MGAIGEKHHSAKLTENDVKEMRKRYEEGECIKGIAFDYPIHYATAQKAICRITWRHVLSH